MSLRNSFPLVAILSLFLTVENLDAQSTGLTLGGDSSPLQVSKESKIYSSAARILTDSSPPVFVNNPPNANQRLRQGLLLAGMTTTTIGYGLFSMKYNSWRARSENTRLLYIEDVRQNAILYSQNNLELDQIASYLAWEKDYESTLIWRERAARAGLLTGLIAVITILDAAVTWPGSADAAHADRKNINFDLQPVFSSHLRGIRSSIRF